MVDFESPLFIRLATKRSNVLERMLSKPSQFRPEAIKLAEYILEKRKESPDYDSYSLHDLIDARNHINEEKFPVRTHYLDLQISTRKRKDYGASKEEKNRAKKDAIKFNPRLSVTIKKGENKPDEETEISLEDFKEYLIDPQYNEYIVVEDYSVKLFIHFDFDKNRYGFFFSYFDKNEQKTYDSIVHGFSKQYSISLLKNFLEKGKSELNQIEWKVLKKRSFLSLTIFIAFLVLYFIIPLVVKYEIRFISQYISNYLDIIRVASIYFLVVILSYNVFTERNQFKHFNKLSGREKIDTVMSLVITIFFVLLIYYGKFDIFIK